MKHFPRLIALALASFFILGKSRVEAAAFKGTFAACKDEAVLKKAFQNPSDTDGKKAAAYFKAKVESGECMQFVRGQQITVDERDGGFWCVRPSGGLDCYWTLEKVVDLNPPSPSTASEGQPRQGKRH